MSSIDFKLEKFVRYMLFVFSVVGIVYSITYAFDNVSSPEKVNVVLVLPFILFLMPFLILSLYGYKKVEAKMQIIPRFLRDVVDNVESGMDLVSSIKGTVDNEYGVLNEDIRKLVNQLSWGVSFEEAFMFFARNVGSSSLKRDFRLVVEARRVGGHVEKILRELSSKIGTDNLRNKQRRSNLASNTFTGYISFVIFLFIIILVYNSLFVGIAENMNSNSFEGDNSGDTRISVYLTLLMLLSYELAILSGFLFGLMQENNIIFGAPHVVVLVVVTFMAFFFFV